MQKSEEVFQVNLKFIRHFFSSLEVLPKQLRQSLAVGGFGNFEEQVDGDQKNSLMMEILLVFQLKSLVRSAHFI